MARYMILLGLLGALMMEGGRAEIRKVSDYFPDLNGDLTKVTWAHAVNSKAKLDAALKDESIMMLEADILMGDRVRKGKGKPKKNVPIMAHPPNTTSDLVFQDFFSAVYHAVNDGAKKGIKLDFKDIESVPIVMAFLNERFEADAITFPVWVNADIWRGPVNATKDGLKGREFIEAVFHYPKMKPTLSVGWTTRYGYDNDPNHKKDPIDVGQYTEQDVQTAIKFLTDNHIDSNDSEITFPVRAGLAVQSPDAMLKLLAKAGLRSTLTLWSAVDDPVDMNLLDSLITQAGKSRVYADFPSSLDLSWASSTTTETSTTPSPIRPSKTSSTTESSTTSSSTSTPGKVPRDKFIITDDKKVHDNSTVVSGSASVTLSAVVSLLAAIVSLI